MSDQAHEWTDGRIEELRDRLERVYTDAADEMRRKLSDWQTSYEEQNEAWQADVASGKRTQQQYKAWLKSQAADSSWQSDMIQRLSADAANVDQIAMQIVNDELPEVFAENANYAAFSVDSLCGVDTMFTLYDADTVRNLVASNPELYPSAGLDVGKDLRWNQQKMTSAMLQGVLQGESIPLISKRLVGVLSTDESTATRVARTACTSAENSGRISSYKRAQNMGIGLKQEWLATLDERTRHEHRLLDGQRVPVGGYFCPDGYGDKYRLRFPGDPQGLPSMVLNCRCTLVAALDNLDQSNAERWSRLPDGMTYEEWKRSKSPNNEDDASEGPTVAGVRRGKPMSFHEANELKGNPRYARLNESMHRYKLVRADYDKGLASLEEVADAYNDYKKALKEHTQYTINCQSCVVAYEARRRGYDVQAVGNTGSGCMAEKVSWDTSLAWTDPTTGKRPDYILYDGKGKLDVRGRPYATPKSYQGWLEDKVSDDERYTIEFGWKGRGNSGHIVSLERINGDLTMYDPQCGKTYTGSDITDYLGNIKFKRTRYGNGYSTAPQLMRVDNLDFNMDVVEEILVRADE